MVSVVYGEKPGLDFFLAVDPKDDWSQVVRPQATPLLTKVSTVDGESTFGVPLVLTRST